MRAEIKGALVAVIVGTAIILFTKWLETQLPNDYTAAYVIGGITCVVGLVKFWRESNKGRSSFIIR